MGIMIDRKNVYDDVNLYATNDIIFEYPLRIEFKDECAIDVGGVCRDMYSAFFEECYKRFFEGLTLVSPTIHPGTDFQHYFPCLPRFWHSTY